VTVQRLAAVRILVGGYALVWLLVRLPHLLDVAGFGDDPRFDPVGPLWFLDRPLAELPARLVLLATVAAGVAAVTGWRWRVSGPAFALLFLAVTTYRNSFGQVWHTENLAALHLLVLAVAPAADAASLDRRRRRSDVDPRPDHHWALRLCSLVTVLAYVVSGWAKVRSGGLDWVTGDSLRNHVAHDNLRKALFGDPSSPIGALALRAGWIFPPMAAMSLLVELGAPVALLVGRVRRAWIATAWLFHVGVLALMAITFPYQLTGIAYASMLPAERILAVGGRWRPRRAGHDATSAASDSAINRNALAPSIDSRTMSACPAWRHVSWMRWSSTHLALTTVFGGNQGATGSGTGSSRSSSPFTISSVSPPARR
jgi:hypothetical protein